ncbi:MAG TPA: arginine--tRNA ligase [Acidimicrobiia bacterium]|jgi:arginyl-tRNA synthetase
MSLLTELSEMLGNAFAAGGLDSALGDVVVSNRPDLAQFQCNGALAGAKAVGRSPRDVAADVVAAIPRDAPFASVEIAGPGFINLTLDDAFLGAHSETRRGDIRVGLPTPAPRRILVDYGGPNVAKELHVGHLRPAIIGESVKRALRYLGHDVVGDVHLGDWGAPMGQLIAELEERHPDLPYFDAASSGPYPAESPVTTAELNEVYPVASRKAKDDPERAAAARTATVELQAGRPGYRALWEHIRRVSIDDMRRVYDMLEVVFELWHGESRVHDRIAPMIERLVSSGVAVASDGAVVVHVAEPNDNREIPPLMLVTSAGGYTYGTTDLATVDERVGDLAEEEVVYVVDARQSLHFEQVFRAARKGGIAGPDTVLEHAPFGTVNGPGGTPLRTREGDLPLLRDLIAEAIAGARRRLDDNELALGYPGAERDLIAELVGVAALKYGDLQNHRTSDYVFDLERFSELLGKTGPYLLYGAVRIKSIMREAAERGLTAGPILAAVHPRDRALMLELARFPEVIDRAAAQRAPNHLAEYAYDVVAAFSRFYEACHILREEDPAIQSSWLGLVASTLDHIETLLDLLAIRIPERM